MTILTNEDIDKLEANRETDALVAEVVLKWHVHSDVDEQLKFDPDNDKECSYYIDEPPEDCPPELRAIAKQIICKRVPNFSTDMVAAWEMEEEIMKHGLTISCRYLDALYKIVVKENELDEERVTSPADLEVFIAEFIFAMVHTTPLQRCKAALKAVMK